MLLAADRDSVAAEYASDFGLTFGVGLPTLRECRAAGTPWDVAVTETFLALLVAKPDTLIARKLGSTEAKAVSARAQEVRRLGGARSQSGRAELERFDAELRDPHNSRNPGTTADLTATAIFVALLEDGWRPDR
jgi:triphosphoribosyl-dephospho-CoA synthase